MDPISVTENFWGWGFSSAVGQLCRMWRTVDLLPCSTKILCVSLVCWTMVSWDFFHFISLSSVRFSCVNSYHSSNFGRVELWFLQICSWHSSCSSLSCASLLGTPEMHIGLSHAVQEVPGYCWPLHSLLFKWKMTIFFNPTFHLQGCLTKNTHVVYIQSMQFTFFIYVCVVKWLSASHWRVCLWPRCLLCHKLSQAIVS